jgi:tetratricopeptide (TPR) repeat protein
MRPGPSDSAALTASSARSAGTRQVEAGRLRIPKKARTSGASTARRLTRSLVNFWMSTSRLPDGDAWFERLLAGPLTRDQDVALSLYEHGYLIFWAGDHERSGRRFTEARAMAAGLGNASIEALALAGLARVALTSDVAEAVRLLREALVITEGLPDDSDGRGSALHVLGPALQMAGDFEGARAVIERRIALARTTGNKFVAWAETGNLSTVERQLGNLGRAEELSLQAAASDIAATSELFLAWTLNGLAAVTAAQGRAGRAAVLLGAADALMERTLRSSNGRQPAGRYSRLLQW